MPLENWNPPELKVKEPEVLYGLTYQFKIIEISESCALHATWLHVTLNTPNTPDSKKQGDLCQVLIPETDGAIGGLISLGLQHGMHPQTIINRLRNVVGDAEPFGIDATLYERASSVADAVAKAMQHWVNQRELKTG